MARFRFLNSLFGGAAPVIAIPHVCTCQSHLGYEVYSFFKGSQSWRVRAGPNVDEESRTPGAKAGAKAKAEPKVPRKVEAKTGEKRRR